VVGFDPHATELPHRVASCTLVFNADYQIGRLDEEGRFLAFARAIRGRYVDLTGHLNPSVPRRGSGPRRDAGLFTRAAPAGGGLALPAAGATRGRRPEGHNGDGVDTAGQG
jgi:hypothetical protein